MYPASYFCRMKKLLLFTLLLLGAASCEDEERSIHYEDMIYFTEIPSSTSGYISAVTELEARPDSQVELLVIRNGFAAQDHPRQTVEITVPEGSSTAVAGADFTLSQSKLTFDGKNTTSIPVQVNIHDAKGKTIVLQLVYEYYNECPAEGRKADRLKIQIR